MGRGERRPTHLLLPFVTAPYRTHSSRCRRVDVVLSFALMQTYWYRPAEGWKTGTAEDGSSLPGPCRSKSARLIPPRPLPRSNPSPPPPHSTLNAVNPPTHTTATRSFARCNRQPPVAGRRRLTASHLTALPPATYSSTTMSSNAHPTLPFRKRSSSRAVDALKLSLIGRLW